MEAKKEDVIRVLRRLEHDFPDYCPALKVSVELGIKKEVIFAIGVYLKDKGLIKETKMVDGQLTWRITGLGIDAYRGESLI